VLAVLSNHARMSHAATARGTEKHAARPTEAAPGGCRARWTTCALARRTGARPPKSRGWRRLLPARWQPADTSYTVGRRVRLLPAAAVVCW